MAPNSACPRPEEGTVSVEGESTSTTYHLTLHHWPAPIACHAWSDRNQGHGAIIDKFLLSGPVEPVERYNNFQPTLLLEIRILVAWLNSILDYLPAGYQIWLIDEPRIRSRAADLIKTNLNMSMHLASGELASNAKENMSVFGLHFTNVLKNYRPVDNSVLDLDIVGDDRPSAAVASPSRIPSP